MQHSQPRLTTLRHKARPEENPFKDKLKDVCEKHNGLAALGDYAVVDLRLYEVIEK
jgi:hypothetical protein